ncbi:unnamed protein product [Penicillium olsonii]|uniref:N-acetyltransferase domain-containing protein n=1 Tax=Penicillium olsonii TaxID=99116 RepID=A0A9W4HJM1_PENOL|nr:unnamed protein product [Penicillium olsonii]CAG8120497.1 unnamed protein product [Penicillium olsonii]
MLPPTLFQYSNIDSTLKAIAPFVVPMAVHYNPITKEPYLQLPAPCANIIITPYREHQIKETVHVMTGILNDPRVYSWLQGPPFPFLPEHGESWVEMKIQENKAVLSALQKEFEANIEQDNAPCQDEKEIFDKCPFLCIREVGERDSCGAPVQDTLIGEIALIRYQFYELRRNSWELALVQAHHNQLPVGHDDLIWSLGYYLSPTHHGKGIMSRAVQTVLRDWALPRMNLKHLRGSWVVGNEGSRRVFERNNFEEVGSFKDWLPETPKKNLGKMSIVIMEWRGLESAASGVARAP